MSLTGPVNRSTRFLSVGHDGPMTSTPAQPSATAYRWDHLRPEGIETWTTLTNTLAEADRTDEFFEAEDLLEELGEHGVDPALDTWAVFEGAVMVAFGQVRVSMTPDHDGRARIWLSGGVHPEHRGRGIGRELIARQEERGAALAAQRLPGASAFWRCDGGLEGATVRRLLEHRGYGIVRYFNLMQRPLPGEPVPEPDLPEGVRLLCPEDSHESAVHAAHTLAFRDHWGSAEQSREQWHDHWSARSNEPDLSVLAVDAEGRVLTYVLAAQWVAGELYVNLVGTVPDARGRGLARAALARVIERAGAAGRHRLVDLHVDSASPTGATRLYEAVGFGLHKTFAAYERVVPGG